MNGGDDLGRLGDVFGTQVAGQLPTNSTTCFVFRVYSCVPCRGSDPRTTPGQASLQAGHGLGGVACKRPDLATLRSMGENALVILYIFNPSAKLRP